MANTKSREQIRSEYFDTTDRINGILKSISAVYPDASKELDKLIGKYVNLHMQMYA